MLQAPKPPATSALIPFVPRQIMLESKSSIDNKINEMEKENKKKKKSKSKTSEALENGSDVPIILENGGKRKDRKLFLSSIAGFLESSGFHKTLSAFRSEAEIESDGSETSLIVLEDIFFKFLESSTLNVEIKDKEKKKKALPASHEENADKSRLEINPEITTESDTPDKSKKKKKHNRSSEDHNENTEVKDHKEKFQEIVEEQIAELKSLTNTASLASESNGKHKSEKKRKKEKKTDSSINSLFVNDLKQTKEPSESVNDKDAISENDGDTEKKAHKKRKRLDSEERTSHDKNSKKSETPQKSDKSLLEHTNTGKKRKTKKGSEISDEAGKISNQEEDHSGQGVEKESGTHQLPNGESDKNETEKGTSTESKKKEKHSAEPKTVNAFQRVKIDEVKFADERLQDNSYWALDDTGSGYGAKAQEVLGQVRGRDFRHEKTKKKRGTYRGGQIDLQSHSIKFNYSDEE